MTTNTTDEVDLIEADVVRPFTRAVLLAALMGIGAQIAIPISAVPGTLQMLFIFLAGLYLGPYWGAGSVLLYLAAGAIGAPIFANYGAGLGVLLGPTGGFLLIFPIAAFIIGLLVHRGGELRDPASASIPVTAVALVLATVLVYAAGFSWYAWVTETGLAESFTVVAAPLIPGDILKMIAAIVIVRTERIDPT